MPTTTTNPLATTIKSTSKAGVVFGTIGAVSAAYVAHKKGKCMWCILGAAAIFGVGGLLIGNAVTKFYE